MIDYNAIIDKYYPAGSRLRDIYLKHSRQVADKAVDIARRKHLNISLDDVETAAMLHDIGIFMTDAEGIFCYGTHPYIAHGYLGADLLRSEGIPETIVRVAERHTGAGITVEDIKQMGLPLPLRDFMPQSMLERLVCYADKFFSKSGDMVEKPIERVRQSMLKHSQETLMRFELLNNEFGD